MRILPELILSIFGILVMVLDPLVDEEKTQKTLGYIAFIGTVAALLSTWYMAQSPGLAFSNIVRVDSFSVFFTFLVIAIAAVVILSSFEYMAVQRIRAGEYYALILFGVVGMALMASAVELVMIFIGLEISSISTYILAGFRRHEAVQQRIIAEVLPARLLRHRVLPLRRRPDVRRHRLHQHRHHLAETAVRQTSACWFIAAMAMMFVGLGFKVAIAPFHIWTPDVYEGAPAPVVGFMSTAPKAAAFAVLLRVVFAINAPGRFWFLWVAAALSMTLGNVGALVQTQRQAPAGLLLDRARRLPARGLRHDHAGEFSDGNFRGHVLHRRLRRHERRRVRRRQPLRQCRRTLRHASRTMKAWAALPRCWRPP